MYWTCKFESIKNLSLVKTFPNKKHKQSNAHEKHNQSFPSENHNRTRHGHVRATMHSSVFVAASYLIDKNCSL